MREIDKDLVKTKEFTYCLKQIALRGNRISVQNDENFVVGNIHIGDHNQRMLNEKEEAIV